ncbi:LysR family transcriptional regulator [Hoeflea prorocentri]|uniref:LysR substrate-binding domain-containing protein n=1 Tax=Hoeflea prorocentri TaxID=1922333 RepID=A0A9X3UQD0_9HYPH|nr:LysR family transcriptional regulator [Hoeflea prorocentri]MCY6383271.1 LysR substrate-binding domain-containing protein [Hoeflea prorocentri]MDA5401071.1 LysR substrate-binding domain-containing protein [Hoeflea prorocentri]
MDRLRAINYFIKVADLGGFTAAAAATGVPASSISRRIQDLETELGVSLLHRTTRVVRLTELGEFYLEHVRSGIEALDYAQDLIKDRAASPSGSLRITATPGYGRLLLLPAIKELRRKYPDLVVDVELTDQLSDLSGNEVDIAVRATANPPDRAIARKLADEDYVLTAAPAYLNQYGLPDTLSDLEKHRTILYRAPGRIIHWQADTDGGWVEARTRPAFICNIGQELVAEAVSGTGLALVPRWGVRNQLANGSLKAIALKDANLSLTRSPSPGIYLLYHQPKYRLNKIRAAVDFLLDHLVAQPD